MRSRKKDKDNILQQELHNIDHTVYICVFTLLKYCISPTEFLYVPLEPLINWNGAKYSILLLIKLQGHSQLKTCLYM